MKLVYFSSSPREGALLLVQKVWTSNIEYQPSSHVWNVENWPFEKPEKNGFINNLYKTIQQNNKAPEKANERLPFVQGKIMVLP